MSARARIEAHFRERHGLTDRELEEDLPLMDFLSSLGLLELLSFLRQDLGVEVDPCALEPETFGLPSQVVRIAELYLEAMSNRGETPTRK